MTPSRKFLNDPMGLRFALWLVSAGVFVAAAWSQSLTLPHAYTVDILTGKFTLLGFAAAIASFHYTGWQRTVRETLNRIYNPEWMAREGRLDLLKEQIASGTEKAGFEYLELETLVDRWHERRLATLKLVLDSELPTTRLVLTDLMSGLYFLVVSSIADLSGLILDPAGTSWRWFSLGSFAGSFGPFFASLFFHIGTLKGNFSGWESAFREVEQESQARLRASSETSKQAGSKRRI